MQMKICAWVMAAVGALCFVTGLLKDQWVDAVCGLGCLCASVGAYMNMRMTRIERKIVLRKESEKTE